MQRKRIILAIVAIALLLAALAYSLTHRSTPLAYSGTIETREINIGSKIGGRVIAVFVEEGDKSPPTLRSSPSTPPSSRPSATRPQATVLQNRADYNRLQHGNRPQEIAEADATLHENAALLTKPSTAPAPKTSPRPRPTTPPPKPTPSTPPPPTTAWSRSPPKTSSPNSNSTPTPPSATTPPNSPNPPASTSPNSRPAPAPKTSRPPASATSNPSPPTSSPTPATATRTSRRQRPPRPGPARLAELDASLREARLTSPADAIVETVCVRPGDLVPANQIVLTLLEPSQLWVKVYVPETDLSRLHLGQSANVTVDALGNSRGSRTFTGRIQEINSSAEFLPRNVQTRDDREHEVFGVKVHIDNPSNILKSGMSATVTLE